MNQESLKKHKITEKKKSDSTKNQSFGSKGFVGKRGVFRTEETKES